MEDLKILEWWAKFHKMPYSEKRRLLTKYLAEKTGVSCEIRLYRSITRTSLQTFKEKLAKPLQDDIIVRKALQEIGIAPTTAHHWYLSTKDSIALNADTSQCKSCPLNGLCEYSIPKNVWQKIQDKYSYLLAVKRLQHTLIKKELFKEALRKKTGITDEEVIRKMLRRIMEKQYYRKNIELTSQESIVLEVLEERNVGVVAVIKWFYKVKDAEQKLAAAAGNVIDAEDIDVVGLEELRRDIGLELLEVVEDES